MTYQTTYITENQTLLDISRRNLRFFIHYLCIVLLVEIVTLATLVINKSITYHIFPVVFYFLYCYLR